MARPYQAKGSSLPDAVSFCRNSSRLLVAGIARVRLSTQRARCGYHRRHGFVRHRAAPRGVAPGQACPRCGALPDAGARARRARATGRRRPAKPRKRPRRRCRWSWRSTRGRSSRSGRPRRTRRRSTRRPSAGASGAPATGACGAAPMAHAAGRTGAPDDATSRSDARVLADYGEPPSSWVPRRSTRGACCSGSASSRRRSRRAGARRSTRQTALEDALVAFAERVRPRGARSSRRYAVALRGLGARRGRCSARATACSPRSRTRRRRASRRSTRASTKLEAELAQAQAEERVVADRAVVDAGRAGARGGEAEARGGELQAARQPRGRGAGEMTTRAAADGGPAR